MAFCFKNTKKDITMTEEGEENIKITTFVEFVRKILNLIKLDIVS